MFGNVVRSILRRAKAGPFRVLEKIRFARDLARFRTLCSGELLLARGSRPRLNLLLPSISEADLFGGISTALGVFDAVSEMLTSHFSVRLIVTEAVPSAKDIGNFGTLRLGRVESDEDVDRQLVILAGRERRQLSVRRGDIFVATFWSTALLARRLIKEQAREYGVSGRKLIYLIQDFEPGFYPWSSEFALVASTYDHEPVENIGVFNTALLRDYFLAQGYRFHGSHCFEPRMNASLKTILLDAADQPRSRRKRILVYGRPSKARNGFRLIVEGLRQWAASFQDASAWEVVSAGERHPSVSLGRGVKLVPRGKLDLEAYAELLLESSAGISLMISPHPSYPPLEMAHFGLNTITNSFANKDLSPYHPNIDSLPQCHPESIADAIKRACSRWDPSPRILNVSGNGTFPFLDDGAPFAFVDALAAQIKAMIQ